MFLQKKTHKYVDCAQHVDRFIQHAFSNTQIAEHLVPQFGSTLNTLIDPDLEVM